MSSNLLHGPLIFILHAHLDIVLTLMHYSSLLGPHMGDIDAFKEAVIGCLSGYQGLVGALDDEALITIVYLRSAHLEKATHATYH
jgi:hypothetical protein